MDASPGPVMIILSTTNDAAKWDIYTITACLLLCPYPVNIPDWRAAEGYNHFAAVDYPLAASGLPVTLLAGHGFQEIGTLQLVEGRLQLFFDLAGGMTTDYTITVVTYAKNMIAVC